VTDSCDVKDVKNLMIEFPFVDGTCQNGFQGIRCAELQGESIRLYSMK